MRKGLASSAAFSLTEILVVIAAIAILAGVALPVVTGVRESAERETAERNLNLLNGAVVAYNNVNRELSPGTAPTGADGSDEEAVAKRLQTRDSSLPGSPYLQAGLTLGTTASNDRYRAAWNGRFFRLLAPGEAGVGIDLQNVSGSVR